MKTKGLVLFLALIMIALPSCSMKNTYMVDSGNINASEILNDISSYEAAESEQNMPQTVSSYNDKYQISCSKNWRLEEKGTLSKDETLFEMSYVQAGQTNTAFQAVEWQNSKQEVKTKLVSELSETEVKENTEAGAEYINYLLKEKETYAEYYVFFNEQNGSTVAFKFKCRQGEGFAYLDDFAQLVNSLEIKQ